MKREGKEEGKEKEKFGRGRETEEEGKGTGQREKRKREYDEGNVRKVNKKRESRRWIVKRVNG
jgi:hypothetical protein